MAHAAVQNDNLAKSYPAPNIYGNRLTNIRRFRRDPLFMLMDGREQCGDFVAAPVLNRSVFMVFHPDSI
ncbi:MAG TPA: hypothetical protein VJZ27_01255, partial [Aggregatilineales bacterium]|nr:hypothetical protein [Aggregatilineales bacterium]